MIQIQPLDAFKTLLDAEHKRNGGKYLIFFFGDRK